MIDNRELEQAEICIDNMMMLIKALRIAVVKLTDGWTDEEKQEFISSCVAEVYDELGLEEND